MDIKTAFGMTQSDVQICSKTNKSQGQVEKKRLKCNTFILNWLIKSQNTAHESKDMR